MALPPSAIAVLGLLARRGPLTHKQLVAESPIPPRTVRYALARLRDEGRVIERHSFRDSRQSYYLLPTGDRAAEASGLLAIACPTSLQDDALKHDQRMGRVGSITPAPSPPGNSQGAGASLSSL